MKKSLSLVVSSALVFSLFSSVAFAADATTTSTAPTTQEMMKDLGFSGTDHDYLDRASAAVSILKGLGIEVDNTATLSFTDVNASDAWAPYIATAAKLGIVHGVDATHFQPFEKVSQQDYAIMLTLGYAAKTGQKVDTTATTDVNAADYAKPYIKAAIDLGLLDASTDWSATAGYDWMVKGAYNAKVASSKPAEPAKVSVASAKATGVQKVEVTLDKAVDTTKASFTVEVDGGSVTVDKTDWSDDKKTATLELDSKIMDGNYTVTLGGLDADAIDQATATFVGQDEVVKSIAFVTASDTIPYSAHATLKLKAENQYGEMVSMGTTDFSAFVSGNTADVSVDNDGYLNVEVDTTSLGYNQGTGVVPVTVYDNTNRVTVSKNFNLGTTPFPSKVEIGDVTYSNGKDNLSKSGDTASIAMKVYDQFGNQMTKDQFADTPNDTNHADAAYSTLNAIITPYDQNVEYEHSENDLFDSDGNLRALVKLTGDEDKNQDLTATVYAGSGSATTTLHVGAGAKPVKVQFGDFSNTVAQDDTGAFYMPIVAYDANGNKLSAQDIVDNRSEFSFSVSNADMTTNKEPAIVLYGDHKGQLEFYLDSNARARNIMYFTLVVANANVNSSATKQVTVQPVRHPYKIIIDGTPATEYLAGSNNTISYDIKDQYGDDMGSATSNIPDSNNTKFYDYQYNVVVTGDSASGLKLVQGDDTSVAGLTLDADHTTATVGDINGDYKFVADTSDNTGTLTVKASIQRAAHGTTDWTDISTVSFSAKKIANDSNLTYTLDTIPTLYAEQDQLGNFLKAGAPYAVADTEKAVETSFFAYQIGATAKDSAGNTVALPADAVKSVVSSNRHIVDYYYGDNAASAGDNDTADHGYLLGGVAGTATVTASVYTNKGTSLALSQDVTVKADPITVDSISADDSANNWDSTNPDVFNYFSDLKVKDQYGNEYDGEAGEITKFNELLGITYTVTSIDGTGTVTIDKDGIIQSIGSDVHAFVVTATAPNGKSVSVTVNNASAYTHP